MGSGLAAVGGEEGEEEKRRGAAECRCLLPAHFVAAVMTGGEQEYIDCMQNTKSVPYYTTNNHTPK